MRPVLDTNVVISGLLWNGTPAQLIETAQADAVELCTSRALLAELTRILHRAKFDKAVSASGMSLATLVTPEPIPPTVLNDPDDDHVLGCALAAKAELIVSGDQDLLALKLLAGIPIVTAAEAARIVATISG